MIAEYETPAAAGALRKPALLRRNAASQASAGDCVRVRACGNADLSAGAWRLLCGDAGIAPPAAQPAAKAAYAWRAYGALSRALRGATPLIRVRDANPEAYLAANAMAGNDGMEIFTTGTDERAMVCARFDNLGKGASGAAIQCMNLMLGLSAQTGLNGSFT